MINFESFKTICEMEIAKYLPAEYAPYTVQIETVFKNNIAVSELMVVSAKLLGGPAFDLNDWFDCYCRQGKDGDISGYLEKMAHSCNDCFTEKSKIYNPELITRCMKDDSRVYAEIINYDANAEMLAGMPHRRIMEDLAIIYKISLDKDASVTLTTKNNQRDEETLYELAQKNTKTLWKPVITSIYGVLGSDIKPSDIVAPIIITNDKKSFGAVVPFLYPEICKKVSEKIGSGFYLLPSSIHEVLCFPDNCLDVDYLGQMVQVVNSSDVMAWREVLSNNVYYYDREKQEIRQVTDNPSIDRRYEEPSRQF